MGLLALAGLSDAGCDEAKSCKPGTVFVRVEPGPNVTANEVGIDVSVDGGPPLHTSLSIPTGSRGGGVEVQFPYGYPSGRAVDISVSLLASGSLLMSRTVHLVLKDACAAITVAFMGLPGTDGGMGDAGDAGGADGGTAGTGGSDVGGTGGSVAGAGGGGTGGTAGLGGGGTGGTAGTGGVAGVGGTAGRGGAGGMAGTGGAAGRGGTGGMCQPTGTENCFNNLDDDCDGKIDCSDADCTPTAQCVPLDPSGGKLGIVVTSTGSCPTGYTDVTVIYTGLSGGACTGCSCRVPTVTACSAPIYSFGTATACATTSMQGTLEVSSFTSTQACTTPSWVGSMFGTILGVAAGPFTPVVNGSCTPTGTATPGPATWTTTSRFCAAATIGGGCSSGQVCAPLTNMPKCAMFDGAHACQAGTVSSSWNTGATDSRMCGACSCGSPTGHGCSNMRINVGTDYTCSPNVTATLSSGQRYCYSSNGVYSPGIVFTGSPTQPTSCPASATASGSLTATGPKTVCCVSMPTTP